MKIFICFCIFQMFRNVISSNSNSSLPLWAISYVKDSSCRTLDNGGTTCKMQIAQIFGSPDFRYDVSHDAKSAPSSPATIRFSLQEGKRDFVCSRRSDLSSSSSASSWQGDCQGDGAILATLITRQDRVTGNPRLFGSLNLGDELCRIHHGSNNKEDDQGEIMCLPAQSFPAEAGPVMLPPSARLLRSTTTGSSKKTQSSSSSNRSLFSPGNATEKNVQTQRGFSQTQRDLSQIIITDLMIVWTKAAECMNSGLEVGCAVTTVTESNMLGWIDLALAESNSALLGSGVAIHLRLVHAFREPNYVEHTTNAYHVALDHITNSTDGIMDHIHSLRKQYGADIVAMLIHDDEWCGLGKLGPDPEYMFSVTNWMCAVGYYSLIHEIGHNYGCQHDRGHENMCKKKGYGFGWRDPQASFRTIMSYSCEHSECDNNKGGGCPRIMYFSSATNSYHNKPLGNVVNDNARLLNENAATVANYFKRPTPNLKPQTKGSPTLKPVSLTTIRPTTCINAEEPCSEWGTCCDGFFCNKQKGLCKTCITENRRCHKTLQCCSTTACINNVCTACIEVGGACSATDECCEGKGLACTMGRCSH